MGKKIIEEITFGTGDLENEGNAKNESRENDNSMTNLSAVKNVVVSVDNNKLLVEVDLDQDLGKTKRGKTQIATTRGNKFYTLDDNLGLGCALSLTVYKD